MRVLFLGAIAGLVFCVEMMSARLRRGLIVFVVQPDLCWRWSRSAVLLASRLGNAQVNATVKDFQVDACCVQLTSVLLSWHLPYKYIYIYIWSHTPPKIHT